MPDLVETIEDDGSIPDPSDDVGRFRLGMRVMASLQRQALHARMELLSAGWGVDHILCEELDRHTRRYADWFEGFRRRWIAAATKGDSDARP